jgi:hypothetical protein
MKDCRDCEIRFKRGAVPCSLCQAEDLAAALRHSVSWRSDIAKDVIGAFVVALESICRSPVTDVAANSKSSDATAESAVKGPLPATAPTFQASIYLAGDIETAKRWLRRFAFDHSMCVTVAPTTIIYTGGEEAGLHVGLVNYPRFPSEPQAIHDLAVRLATGLVYECCQITALVVSGLSTEWIQVQPPGAARAGG